MKHYTVKGYVNHTFTAYDGYGYYKETETIDDEFSVEAENETEAQEKAKPISEKSGMIIESIIETSSGTK